MTRYEQQDTTWCCCYTCSHQTNKGTTRIGCSCNGGGYSSDFNTRTNEGIGLCNSQYCPRVITCKNYKPIQGE